MISTNYPGTHVSRFITLLIFVVNSVVGLGESVASPLPSDQRLPAPQSRSVLYLPDSVPSSGRYPLVAFGHGVFAAEKNYQSTLIHLAENGIAVLFVGYQKQKFDFHWWQMSDRFNSEVEKLLSDFPELIDEDQIVYAGHSMGGGVAVMAASQQTHFSIKEVIAVSPPYFDGNLSPGLESTTKVSIYRGESDKIVQPWMLHKFFKSLKSENKVLRYVESIDGQPAATHTMILDRKFETQNLYLEQWFWPLLLKAFEDL